MARIAKIFSDSEDENSDKEEVKTLPIPQRKPAIQEKKFISPAVGNPATSTSKSDEPQVFRFGGKIIPL
jgi:hypothetical protein